MAAEPASTGDFAAMHTELSTDPESGCVRLATVMSRSEASVEILRGCVFSRGELWCKARSTHDAWDAAGRL